MTPARLSLLALALLAAASLVPATTGAPSVPMGMTGAGAALTVDLQVHGLALEGGAFDRNYVCGTCLVRFATSTTGFTLVDTTDSQETARDLPPGLYELREFRGLFSYNVEGRNAFFVTVHGAGKVERIG